MPTLVVVGERDPLVSKERVEEVGSQPPDVTVAHISGAAPALSCSHPVELAAIVRARVAGDPVPGGQRAGRR